MSKKKIWISIGVITVIAIMLVIFIMKGRASSVDMVNPEEMEILVQKVAEEELDETILVTGQIVPENEQKIYAEPENGEIKEFKVEENKNIKKGDTLFTYDGEKLQNELNAAVRARDMVKNSTSAIQNQISQLNKEIEQMKKEMKASQSEEEGVFITKEDIRQLEIEKNQLVLEAENSKAEEAAAQAEINELDKEKQALTVKSKMSGTVVKLNKNLERTEDGMTEPVVHIVSDEPFKVIGTMSEFDTVKIKEKQKVIVRPKVYKDREWKGSVESVSEYPTDDATGEMDMYGGESNVTMYPFKVAITDDTKDLRQGFHVSLEVNVGGDKKKVVVPHMAILDDMMMGMEEDEEFNVMDEMFDSGEMEMMDESPYVFVLVDGVLERRDIETGEMNDEFVEVISGVELGELVVISPEFEMYDGMEVASYDEVE